MQTLIYAPHMRHEYRITISSILTLNTLIFVGKKQIIVKPLSAISNTELNIAKYLKTRI